jgi:glycosyltransferase involved in cell wall biosynthesis
MTTGGYIYDRKLVDYLRSAGWQIIVVKLPGRNYMSRLKNNLQMSLYRHLESLHIDLLLEDELDHAALYRLNRRLKTSTNILIVSIVHHLRCCELRPSWQNNIYRWIEKRYLNNLDGFIFNSRNTCKAVEALLGKNRQMVIAPPSGNLVPPYISDEEIACRATLPGALRILFLGNVVPRKGLHVLLSALASMQTGSFHAAVVGDLSLDSGYSQKIYRYINKNGLNGRVELLGAISDVDLKLRMKESQVLAVPSSYEGFGMAYLEGMGFGLPAIGAEAGGATEIITGGLNGFLVSAGDSEMLAGLLRKLQADRKLLTTLSLNARRTYASHPKLEVTGNSVLTYLETLKSRFG